MKVVIIEDEALSQDTLKVILENYCEDVTLMGMAADVPEGVKLINRTQPDLVFLDVEMPGYTGFQLLDFFSTVNFDIVFTTAYEDYALRAFQVSAIDYLLKPLQIPQVIKAIEKARKNKSNKSPRENVEVFKINQKEAHFKKIALTVADSLVFVEPDDIVLLVADGSYTTIYLRSAPFKVVVSRNLTHFEQLLTHKQFFRAHRSNLVNVNHIKEFIRSENLLHLNNGEKVSIARDKKDELMLKMNIQ